MLLAATNPWIQWARTTPLLRGYCYAFERFLSTLMRFIEIVIRPNKQI